MALDIQPPNFGGMIALAGRNPGNLNLTVPGALGLQALQLNREQEASLRQYTLQQQQLRQQAEAALRQHVLQGQQLQQQGSLGQGELDLKQQNLNQQGLLGQGDLNLRKIALEQQGLLGQGELAHKQQMAQQQNQIESAYKQGDLDLRKQALIQDQQAKELAKLLDQDKKLIKEKGAFAAYGLMSMKGAKTPEEANSTRVEILKEALAKEYISKEEAEVARKQPLTQFTNGLQYEVLKYGAVSNYKEMMDTEKNKTAAVGTQIEFNPDGSISSISQDPTASMKTETQKELKAREIGLQQLSSIRDKFDPSAFTYKGKADRRISAIAELSKGIPGLEQATEFTANKITGKDAEERGKSLETATAYLNSVEQFFNTYRKDITGAAAAEKEIERLRKSFINGDLSSSQFKGALDQLLIKYTSEAEFNKYVLNTGLDTSSKKTFKYNPDTGKLE